MRRALIIAAGWTLCGVLLAAQAHISASMRGQPIGWVRPLAIWLAWAWIWALFTPAILRLTARYPFGRARALRSVLVPLVAIPVSLVGAVFLMQVLGFTVNLLTILESKPKLLRYDGKDHAERAG